MQITATFSILLAYSSSSLAAKSAGCGQRQPRGLKKGETGRSNSLTFDTSAEIKRRYLLHVPTSYDINTPVGLVWSFHGRGKDSETQEAITKLSDSNSNPDHIVVYPQASTGTSNSRRQANDNDSDAEEEESNNQISTASAKAAWQGDPNSQADDIAFTLELLENITKTFCIDEDKVYASGTSNGGGFAVNVLACDSVAANKFAAFASASGAYYQNDAGDCNADTGPIKCDNKGAKIALITTHGGRDDTIPYEGGRRRESCLPSVPHFVTAWAERNGLDSANSTSKVGNSEAMRYSFGEGAAAGLVQSYYIPELTHRWATRNRGGVSGTQVFMDFFAQWNMTARTAAASSVSESAPSASPSSESGAAQPGASFYLVLTTVVVTAISSAL